MGSREPSVTLFISIYLVTTFRDIVVFSMILKSNAASDSFYRRSKHSLQFQATILDNILSDWVINASHCQT